LAIELTLLSLDGLWFGSVQVLSYKDEVEGEIFDIEESCLLKLSNLERWFVLTLLKVEGLVDLQRVLR
jgi:hypothetical protein